MAGTWPRCIWSSCWQVSECTTPLRIENSFSTSSAFFIFITMLLADINLALCNRLDGVGTCNSCVHEVVCKSSARFYVYLIFSICQCGDSPPFVPSVF